MKKLLISFSTLLFFLLTTPNQAALAQGCNMESFTIEQNGVGVNQVTINQDTVFKIRLSDGCNYDGYLIVHYDSGPNACKKGNHELSDSDRDNLFVSDAFSFLEGEQTAPGETCVYKQDDLDAKVTFTVQSGKIPCYQYFNDTIKEQYRTAGKPSQWSLCDDSCKNVLDLSEDLDSYREQYSCADDSVKARYESCQNKNLTHDANSTPQCVNDSKLTSEAAYACQFTFNNASEPTIDYHKFVCPSGKYACSSGGEIKCQTVPNPIVSIPLLQRSLPTQLRILTTTDVAINVDRCVLPGDVKLFVDETQAGKGQGARNGAGITFSHKFKTPGSHQVSATCNNKPSNKVTITVENEAFSIQAIPSAGDTALYVNYPFTLSIQGCTGSGKYVRLTDNNDQDEVGGIIPDNQPFEEGKKYTYTKAGKYVVTAVCGHNISGGRYQKFSADETISIAIDIIDKADIKPDCSADYQSCVGKCSEDQECVKKCDETKSACESAGYCEICHPDWPVYEGNHPQDERCRGGPATDEKYKYKVRPVEVEKCEPGYECNHVIGCVLPTGGLTPPPQPCLEGKDKEGNITTDPDKIATCTKFSTAIAGFSLTPTEFISTLLGILLSISGMIALLIIIWTGYKMMMSRGNPEKIEEAKEQLTSAITGLLFIILSIVILEVIGVDILKIPDFGG